MPKQELDDFAIYWQESMLDSRTGNAKPPGGPEHTDLDTGLQGIDYEAQLIPWCKGNSVSVDQNTLQLYRNLMSALVENYRTRLRWVDARPTVIEINSEAGLTSDDLRLMYGEPATKRTRNHAAGEATRNWKNAEFLFVNLLIGRHIDLYSSDNTLSNQQNRIIDAISSGAASDFESWMPKPDKMIRVVTGKKLCCYLKNQLR